MIQLFEDNTGDLYIRNARNNTVYENLEPVDCSSFVAQSLLLRFPNHSLNALEPGEVPDLDMCKLIAV